MKVARAEAIERGLKRYFTGVPCQRGHVAERFCPSGTCVECRSIRNSQDSTKEWFRQHYQNNKPRRQEQMKANYAATKHLRRPKYLEREYQITVEQYEAMAAAQNNCCAICKTKADGRPLYVDHCHASKQVRGLLCLTCNFMLGYAYDTPDTLVAGAEYLRSKSQ